MTEIVTEAEQGTEMEGSEETETERTDSGGRAGMHKLAVESNNGDFHNGDNGAHAMTQQQIKK